MPVIDKNVPVARWGLFNGTHPNFPFLSMEVGDSFLFPLKLRSSVACGVFIIKQKTGRRFCTHKQDALNCRVWRIE